MRSIPGHFRPDQPGRVYLMRHARFRALKVGVAGRSDEARTESIEADGWELLGSWWFGSGFDALAAEEALLDRWWNVFSLRPVIRPEQLLQSDSIETVRDSTTNRRDAVEFLDRWSRDAAGQEPSPWATGRTGRARRDWVDPWVVSLDGLDVAS